VPPVEPLAVARVAKLQVAEEQRELEVWPQPREAHWPPPELMEVQPASAELPLQPAVEKRQRFLASQTSEPVFRLAVSEALISAALLRGTWQRLAAGEAAPEVSARADEPADAILLPSAA
jgi:hypothetical protein